jgi:DNA modification methylase
MKFVERPEYGPFLTFQPSKRLPVYDWFYYKEAFSPQLVKRLVSELGLKEVVLDPFCGVGTTLLTCKALGMQSVGFDANPIALLASRVKCADYDLGELKQSIELVLGAEFEPPTWKWRFELFPPARAFSRGSFEEILFLRQRIEEVEDKKAKEFLLLALAGIVPETSFTLKDGGVLRLVRGKRVPPAREMFRRKVLGMYGDLKHARIIGPVPSIEVGDARMLPLEGEVASIVTSPPYLNNVDYTKVYGLELSLLLRPEQVSRLRQRMLRSFVEREAGGLDVASEVQSALGEASSGGKVPLVAYAYFEDMNRVLKEFGRVLESGGKAAIAVSNAVLPGASIEVDRALGLLAEGLGFKCEVWVGARRWAQLPKQHRREAMRESIIILEK